MNIKTIIISTIASGLIAGTIAPIIVSYIGYKIVWKKQKLFELKHRIFSDAVIAISRYQAEANDPGVQSKIESCKGIHYETQILLETNILMYRSRLEVKTFYSEEAYKAYDKAIRTRTGLNFGNFEEFENNRTEAMKIMAKELGISTTIVA